MRLLIKTLKNKTINQKIEVFNKILNKKIYIWLSKI